jgi:aldose 1-epimerase
VLTLHADDSHVVVSPELGGSVQRFTVGDIDVLRRGQPDRGAMYMASFPMVPFCNRIEDGQFTWNGRLADLGTAPEVGEPHAIHGQGWRWRWDVLDSDDSKVTLSYLHPAGRWPWRYRATQTLTLEPGRLDQTITLENLSDEPMPYSLGFHPWFERPARITANVDGMWVGDDVFPDRWIEADAFRSFDVDRADFDNAFTGWDGKAMIDFGEWRLQMSADTDRLHVYTPAGHGFFAVEPTGSTPGAFNHPEREPLDALDPGATTDRFMRLSIT